MMYYFGINLLGTLEPISTPHTSPHIVYCVPKVRYYLLLASTTVPVVFLDALVSYYLYMHTCVY